MAFIHEQWVTHVSGEALLDCNTTPSANGGKQGCQRTERNQSKHDVLGKKRECEENSDAQKVAAGTGLGISHYRVETIAGGSELNPQSPKALNSTLMQLGTST